MRRAWLRGSAVTCPCCGRSYRRFATYRGRANAQCPGCGSLSGTASPLDHLIDPHVAVQRSMSRRTRSCAGGWARARSPSTSSATRTSAPTSPRLPFRTGTFELVVCSHVLEHVPDDRGALAELERVHRTRGPGSPRGASRVRPGHTYEDPSITTPAARARAFGQSDHVRIYGRNVRERVGERWEANELEDGFFMCRPART